MTVQLDTTPPLVVDERFFEYSGKRVLCSGRIKYHTQKHGDFVARVLNELSPGFVLHGGDDGLDRWVQWWCLFTKTPFAIVPCHMQGRLRSEQMVHMQHRSLLMLAPEIVVAFPGVDRNVIRQAAEAEVPVLRVAESMFDTKPPLKDAADSSEQKAMNPA